MKITVERSGGIAALTRVEACPWDAVPDSRPITEGQPDRFMYSIRAGEHRATLPERAVTGPWRVLVETTRAAAEELRTGGGAAGFRS
jgi:hypothetical protein